jgi:hypothetical protein
MFFVVVVIRFHAFVIESLHTFWETLANTLLMAFGGRVHVYCDESSSLHMCIGRYLEKLALDVSGQPKLKKSLTVEPKVNFLRVS